MKNVQFDIELQKIRLKFLKKLQGWLPEIKLFFNQLNDDNQSLKEIEPIKIKFHQLSGSGKTFGFAEISEISSGIEEILEKLQESKSKKNSDKLVIELKNLYANFLEITKKILEKKDKIFPKDVTIKKISEKKSTKKQFKIFSVDDDPLVRDFLESGFEKAECKIIHLKNGLEVFKKLKHEIPDLIILDINMSKMSGVEVLKKLKADKKLQHIPVVMLTKRAEDKDVFLGFSSGAVDYVIKPFKMEDLIERALAIIRAQNVKILIVDDDKLVTEVVEQKLLKKGYIILKCDNGNEVLGIIEKEKPGLILLDIMLPGTDGFTILKHIKSNREMAQIPVIVVTAKKQQNNILKYLKNGAHDCITKPFDPEEIVIKIESILQE